MDSRSVARYRRIVMNAPPKQSKFQAYRARKRAAGLREVRKWLPDTRSPEFIAEAKRQSLLIDRTDDEREVSEMMKRLTEEAWHDWK